MSIDISISDGPLTDTVTCFRCDRAGALVMFEGIVRGIEQRRPIDALDYEVYEPMASAQLRRLAVSLRDELGLLAVCVEHSRGRVPVGGCSFRLQIASAHRKQAIQAMDAFIDQLKQDVPIWKKPVFAGN